jgi:hypothetical protein
LPLLAPLAHPVAMILPNFWILLVAAVGGATLLPPVSSTATLTAVRLPSIAWPADKKHHATVHRPAK